MTFIFLLASQSLETIHQGMTGSPALPVQPVAESMTIMDIIVKGGVLMIPIAILSIVAVYIFAERYATIRRYVRADVLHPCSVFLEPLSV